MVTVQATPLQLVYWWLHATTHWHDGAGKKAVTESSTKHSRRLLAFKEFRFCNESEQEKRRI
jgi:hypothetical protein